MKIIYKAENKERKCFYIGATTKGLEKRKHQHFLESYKDNNIKFYNFIKKYGWESFIWTEIAEYETAKELFQAEKEWLSWHKEKYPDWEVLNSRDAGGGGNYWAYLPEERKVEIKQKIKEHRPNTSGKNNPFYGKHHTEKTKEKLRKPKSEKQKEKQSKIMKNKYKIKENHPRYGAQLTTKQKEKQSKIMKNKFIGEKNPMYGKKHTEETKLKMKIAWEKRKQNKE